jgi:2,4-dienoyl-CoA reductase-like NADH-dependent reductase (Old Yellow Enzyme family)
MQVRRLRSPAAFAGHLEQIGAPIAFDEQVVPAPDGVLARPASFGTRALGNRFAILPMEGWDGSPDGAPSDLVRRRWRRFGESGAKLVWGGEAVAVRHDGRANPRQLVINERTVDALQALRAELVAAHADTIGRTDDLVVGLQLTHSGRFARPDDVAAPRTAYAHPLLDARVGAGALQVLTDDELDHLVDDFVRAATRARDAGFDFVDVKCCHGYLGHELLTAFDRPGRYGGDFDGRTRFVRTVIEGISRAVPDLAIGVRLSAFDTVPYRRGDDGTGEPVARDEYPYAFGGDGTGDGIDLAEPDRLLTLLEALGVVAVCVTAGSPYYCPHVQRPAYHPPSDGYEPPRDPLVDVARLLQVTAELRRRHAGLLLVGSGYSYLQEWLPNVAQRQVAEGAVDVVGIGRMALSYPSLPADVLAGRPLQRQLLCRTFSDCTTAPRNGLVSGCYPLDAFYKERPERRAVVAAKRAATP